MSPLSLPTRALPTTGLAAAALLLLSLAARPLVAQEGTGGAPPLAVEPRIATAAGGEADGEAAAARRAAVERTLRAARGQERRGQGLTFIGAAGAAGAYAAWVRDGRMGMSGRQAALFMGATGVATLGARQWIAGRVRAARARDERGAATR